MANVRLALIASLVAAPALAAAAPPPHALYATQSGGYAYDADEFGGNPFASALILALQQPGPDQIARVEMQTGDYSGGYQVADGSELPAGLGLNPLDDETAVALVVVFADYGDSAGLVSLPGAAYDAVRVAAALGVAGYQTQMVVARDAGGYRSALRDFTVRSATADRALIYTTGHGTEPAPGQTFLLPPDLDRVEGLPLSEAIPLREVGGALRARNVNLLLYAGCRERGLPGGGPRRRS